MSSHCELATVGQSVAGAAGFPALFPALLRPPIECVHLFFCAPLPSSPFLLMSFFSLSSFPSPNSAITRPDHPGDIHQRRWRLRLRPVLALRHVSDQNRDSSFSLSQSFSLSLPISPFALFAAIQFTNSRMSCLDAAQWWSRIGACACSVLVLLLAVQAKCHGQSRQPVGRQTGPAEFLRRMHPRKCSASRASKRVSSGQ